MSSRDASRNVRIAVAQRLDLVGGHDALGDAQQDDRPRRSRAADGASRPAGSRCRDIAACAADRRGRRTTSRTRRDRGSTGATAATIDRPPAKLMPIMPTRPSGASARLLRQPQRRVLDHVGRARRDAVPRQVGRAPRSARCAAPTRGRARTAPAAARRRRRRGRRARAASRGPTRRAAVQPRREAARPRQGTVSARSSNGVRSRAAPRCARTPASPPPGRRTPRRGGSRSTATARDSDDGGEADRQSVSARRIAVDNISVSESSRRPDHASARDPHPGTRERSADHRHRRAVGRRQGHDRARGRGAPRLPPHRHRRHVPRAGVEGARTTGSISPTRRRSAALAARARVRDRRRS